MPITSYVTKNNRQMAFSYNPISMVRAWGEHQSKEQSDRFYAESARYFPFGAESCGRFGFRVWQNVLVLLYV